MSQRLSLSRAAHLIGTTRAVLQRHIAAGELSASDGVVTVDDLLKLYPELKIEDSGVFEHTVRIRDEAFKRRIRERVLPNQEILAQRLAAQSEELEDVRRHLAAYHDFVEALNERIELLDGSSSARQISGLRSFFDKGLAEILGSETRVNPVAVMNEVMRMTIAHALIRPSGHEFFIEGSETILDAALRAGLAPAYGCGNGNCGLCKVRIVSGQTQQIKSADYPLSVSERAQGHVLMCAHSAVSSDLTIEMIEAASPGDIPEQEIVAKLRQVTPLAKDVLLLHLQTPRSMHLRFLAGQSVSLSVTGSTALFSADYPIASCPCDGRNLLFHISRNAEDEFAERLFAGAMSVGDPVSIHGPFGDFVLNSDVHNSLIFLACDTGFAPIKSLIEHAVAADIPANLHLIWVVTQSDGHYLENQCRAWADALETFSYALVSATDAAYGSSQAVSQLLVGQDIAHCDYYAAGSQDFLRAMEQLLHEMGVFAKQLRTQLV